MSFTRRQKRRLYNEYLSNIEQERNGRPIPGEILELMTKPKAPDMLHQIMVTVRDTGKLVPLGPMMCADACGISVEALNRQIAQGQRRDWTKAEAYPMTPITQGAN